MKIVGILGSPRKNSNSSALARKAIDAAVAMGAESEIFVLNELEFKGCQACMACKLKSEVCCVKDGLTPVLEGVRAADAVVFASPVYFWDVSGQFKSFFDRMYSFFAPGHLTRLKPSKKAALIMVQAQPNDKLFSGIIPKYEMFLRMFGFHTHTLRGIGHHDAGSVLKDEDLMKQAELLGQKLMK